MDVAQIETNITLEQTLRRANLLAAAAQVSQHISQIRDIDQLLPKTVDIICEAYDFYYVGVFLIDEAGEFAVLQAGRGEPGRIMVQNHHKLAVGGNSMIGACTAFNEARISLDVDREKVWYPNPVLPDTRSEMALPLVIGERVIGAVTVQSIESAAFSEEDISSLQAMANQLAIAIDNAHQRHQLEETHAKLVRAKTFEAIATATGDAIHWIGNKAEPIAGAVQRVQQDLGTMLAAIYHILNQANTLDEVTSHPLIQALDQEVQALSLNLLSRAKTITQLPAQQVSHHLSLASILEDLQIIDEAGRLIMQVKEDLIGPAREQAPRPTMIDDVVKDAINCLDIPAHFSIRIDIRPGLPLVLADPLQLNRVFVNLIQNAADALVDQPNPEIRLIIQPDRCSDFILVDVADNGPGIAASDLEKIWITFHTTKGLKGHTGLGLPACKLILDQVGGRISATSQLGHGSTFTVSVPVYKAKDLATKHEGGHGKILVIDDNDRWRHFAQTTLENQGYRVTVAGPTSGAGRFKQYDLILIDDILSEVDAFEIMKTIQREGAIGRTIAVSSSPRVERAKECKLLGAHNLLPKPYTRSSLLSEVHNAIQALRLY